MSNKKLIHGFHAVNARLWQNPKSVLEIFLAGGRQDARAQAVLDKAASESVKAHIVDKARLDSLTGNARHQGVVAMIDANQNFVTLDDVLENLAEPPLLLILDGVTDPHNLGACLRVCDGAGAHAVVAPTDHAVGINATVAKVASGAAETVPYLMVTNLARALGEMKERGVRIIGTSDDAEHTLYDLDLTGPVALVLGAEDKGMRQLTRKTCDALVSIPMAGAVESLNVSVAAAVCLYEARRQRRAAAAAAGEGEDGLH